MCLCERLGRLGAAIVLKRVLGSVGCPSLVDLGVQLVWQG